jgi:hypothetical protein
MILQRQALLLAAANDLDGERTPLGVAPALMDLTAARRKRCTV